MKLFFSLAIATITAAASGAAAPIVFTLELQGTGSSAASLTFSPAGNPAYALEVTALSNNAPALITRRGTDGIGVDGGTFLDQQDLDGFNGIEALLFTPNFAFLNARVLSISFTNLDTLFDDDEALIAFDGAMAFNGVLSTTVSNFSSSAFTNAIRIQSTDSNDNFSVRQITLEVEPVPEPGAITLLGLGLLTLAYAGRPRAKA